MGFINPYYDVAFEVAKSGMAKQSNCVQLLDGQGKSHFFAPTLWQRGFQVFSMVVVSYIIISCIN